MGQHVEQAEDGVLNLADKLQEAGHDTEGDDTATQLQTAPDEGKQVAKTKSESQQ